jgi:allophanate hydrolase subunit 2
VVRRFGREGFRSTLISRSGTLDQLALNYAAAA